MRIAIGSDHAGFELKQRVVQMLLGQGHDVVDIGPDSDQSVDYPLFAQRTAREVAEGSSERGVLVCGSGVGVTISANKVDGVRAVNAHDPDEAEMSRRHNDVNVLCLAGRRLLPADAEPIIKAFLETEFEGGRHQRRVDQMTDIEQSKDVGDRPRLKPKDSGDRPRLEPKDSGDRPRLKPSSVPSTIHDERKAQ